MLELEHRFRVVDVHARLEPPGEDSVEGPAIAAEKLDREMRQAGVVRAVVFPGPRPAGTGYLEANNAVARVSVERPFVAFARINGVRDPGTDTTTRIRNFAARRKDHHTTPADVEQYAYDDRFQGFKCDPTADGLPDGAVLDRLEAVGKPLIVHGGAGFPPEVVEKTLFGRDLPVVVAHFGGYPADRELMARTLEFLGEYDDCYVDTSFVRYRDLLERGLREHPDRVLFGSGVPAIHPNVAIMEVLTLDVTEDAMRRVFSKNPSRVIAALEPGQ